MVYVTNKLQYNVRKEGKKEQNGGITVKITKYALLIVSSLFTYLKKEKEV